MVEIAFEMPLGGIVNPFPQIGTFIAVRLGNASTDHDVHLPPRTPFTMHGVTFVYQASVPLDTYVSLNPAWVDCFAKYFAGD